MGAIQAEKYGDKYILLDRIATGGMAEVYRGKLTGEKGFEKQIAIKRMLPQLTREKEMVDRFSLFLSMREDIDERIQSALDKMMEQVEW